MGAQAGELPDVRHPSPGPYAEIVYKQLLIFLIEQLGLNRVDLCRAGIATECLDSFYDCFGDRSRNIFRDEVVTAVDEIDPPPRHTSGRETPQKQTSSRKGEPAWQAEHVDRGGPSSQPPQSALVASGIDLLGEDFVRAAHIAVAGEVVGKTRLFTGEVVDVINPVLRGMTNWNTEAILTLILAELHDPSNPVPIPDELVEILILKLVAKLYELVRNEGRSDADRAINYFATSQLLLAAKTLLNPTFLAMLGVLDLSDPIHPKPSKDFVNITADTLTANLAVCNRLGAVAYDVELSFFTFANQFSGSAVIAQTIDVSDDVPTPLSRPRPFPRRSR